MAGVGVEVVEQALACADHALVAPAPLLGLARRLLALHVQRGGEERHDDDREDVELQVEQRPHLAHGVGRSLDDHLARVPVADEPEDREAEGGRAQPEAQRRPDEEGRAQVGKRRDRALALGALRERDPGRDHQAGEEHHQLGHAQPCFHQRLAIAAPAPREDERGDQHHRHEHRNEIQRPPLPQRDTEHQVLVARVRHRHARDQRDHADQERGQALDRVDLHARARQAPQPEGDDQRRQHAHEAHREHPGGRRLPHGFDRQRGEERHRQVDGPAAHRRDQEHAEGYAMGGPDEHRQVAVQGQTRRSGGEREVNQAERHVGGGLAGRAGVRRDVRDGGGIHSDIPRDSKAFGVKMAFIRTTPEVHRWKPTSSSSMTT